MWPDAPCHVWARRMTEATRALTETINVDGRYLYGAPAAGLSMEGEVNVSTTREWDGFDGYQFGLADEEGGDGEAVNVGPAHDVARVALGLLDDRLAKFWQTSSRGVAVVLRVANRQNSGFHDVLRGSEIWLSGSKRNDIFALSLVGFCLGINLECRTLGDGCDSLRNSVC